jgi:hypothetical protein
MDKTLTALKAAFHGFTWESHGNYWIGTGDTGRIMVWLEYSGRWWASGTRNAAPHLHGEGDSPCEAVEGIVAAMGAAIPEDWGDPNMPGPAALGCPALAALMGLVGMAGGALVLGMAAVRWLTGGAS